ncbi:MAG TPA: YciI family protein [Solirubrobacteraceae bacterium]|nr:YciI family protein [Solirubrobacteraceae bacterium]
MKYLLFYTPVEDVLARAPAHFPAHRARLDEFHARGDLLMVGTFADPREGSMAVFTSREAAEEFVAGDPFVDHGVVARWEIREWDEVLVPVASA